MDEAVGNNMPTNGVNAEAHILNKEHSLKTSNSIIDSHQFVAPSEGDHNDNPTHFLTNRSNGRNLDRRGSSVPASVSPRCMDDSGNMVEELTFGNYSGENLATVGTSNNREMLQNKYIFGQRGSGSVSANSEEASRGKGRTTPEDVKDGIKDDDKNTSTNIFSSGGTRTKMLSKFGPSEYYVKSSLKGKGVVFKGPVDRRLSDMSGNRTTLKSTATGNIGSNAPLSYAPLSTATGNIGSNAPLSSTVMPNATLSSMVMPITSGVAEAPPDISTNPMQDGVSLRDWLKTGQNKANKKENLSIFKQIVKLVELTHSQGLVLQDLQPSYFKFLPSSQIVYLGSSAYIDLSDSVLNQDIQQSESERNEKRPLEQNLLPFDYHCAKKQKFGDGMFCAERFPIVSDMPQPVSTSGSYTLEKNWYSSPELLTGTRLALSSNIYSLGVLLFELLSSFDSRKSHEAAMLDLRNRILPAEFLTQNPMEAGFCLLLLHPNSSSRPSTSQILQSGIMCGVEEFAIDNLLPSIEEREAESELLMYFLSSLEEKKQENASKLAEEVSLIETDIEEVLKRRTEMFGQNSPAAKGDACIERGNISSNLFSESPLLGNEKSTKKIRLLENAYFSMRSRVQFPVRDSTPRGDTESLRARENWHSGKDPVASEKNDRLGVFYTDLCKYARYSKFRVRGVLRNGDLTNSANVICSLSFDRDEEYLATAGVSKKIKIFEFQSLFDGSVDIHYPAVEMSNKSKLSCVSWNSYIRNYLASTDYDGAVKLWDASTGQEFSEFTEHTERAWSVDFSRLDPKKFASGSDDRLVKLWSINEKKSLCTIRNNANVCSVQFSPEASNFLTYSSADYKTYCYDLRNISIPWCILAGHEKAVSYAKFLDAETLVSASTDNSLKIWDLKKTSSNSLSRDACVLTLRGHTNEKNFVGLSVSDGFISCGSETNEVFAYYRSLPMPITSAKFGSIDPISGRETEDDNGQFVSSVCWRRKSNMVVAANSTGSIKLLEMV